MGLNDKKITGQALKIAAQDWNATIDAARAERARQRDQRVEAKLAERSIVTAKVRNNSAPVSRFAAVALRAPIIAPADNLAEFHREPTFDAYVADASDVAESPTKPAIVLQPLASGAIGDACVCGVVPARVDMQDAQHRFAELTVGRAYLTSGVSGPVEILWAESGLGVKWALVRIPAFPTRPSNFYDLINQTSPPPNPPADSIRLYQLGGTLYFIDSSGNAYAICASGPPGPSATITESKNLQILLDKCILRLRWDETFVTFERNATGCIVGMSTLGPFARESSVDLCDCKPEYCGGGYYGGGGS